MISSITCLEASTRACRSSRVEAAKAELTANRNEKLRIARVFFIDGNLIRAGPVAQRGYARAENTGGTGKGRPEDDSRDREKRRVETLPPLNQPTAFLRGRDWIRARRNQALICRHPSRSSLAAFRRG